MKEYSLEGIPAILEAGALRGLGFLPADEDYLLSATGWGDEFVSLPRSDWYPASLVHLEAPVKNQGSSSSCLGHAASTAYERAYQLLGQPPEVFCPWWLYSLCNGGKDQGASPRDMMTALVKYGAVPFRLSMPGNIRNSDFSPAIREEAARRKALSTYWCRDFDEMCSALCLGHALVCGILVGNNLGQLDKDGVAPLPDRVIGGHALAPVALRKHRGEWQVLVQNSWGKSWGQKGFCWLRQEHFPWQNGSYQVFAIRALGDDPGEKESDPPVVTE